MSKKTHNNKAFTLIELIVVMAVIAVLVLLAAPSFLNYTKDAKVTALQQDTKVLSDAAEMYYMKKENWPKGEIIEKHDIGGVDKLYTLDKTKLDDSIKNIKGDYSDYAISTIGEYEGQVFHLKGIKDKNGKIWHNYQDEIDLDKKYKKYLASDDDFSGEGNGQLKYDGTAKIVLMPHEIKGEKLTSYKGMFMGSDVKKVISTNKDIVNTSHMFESSKSDCLDVSDLDTSNVTNMRSMFKRTEAKHINLDGFNTSKAVSMYRLFDKAKVEELDISNIDTRNAESIAEMFRDIKIDAIDISHFDTSKVTSINNVFEGVEARTVNIKNIDISNVENLNTMFGRAKVDNLIGMDTLDTSNVKAMKYMFYRSSINELDLSSFSFSKAIDLENMLKDTKAKIGYAKTQKESDTLNSLPSKPKDLTFTVK